MHFTFKPMDEADARARQAKNGIIHVGLQMGTLRTLNTSNGIQRWYYHTGGTIYSSSPPVVA